MNEFAGKPEDASTDQKSEPKEKLQIPEKQEKTAEEISEAIIFEADQNTENLQKEGENRLKGITESFGVSAEQHKEVSDKLGQVFQKSKNLLKNLNEKIQLVLSVATATIMFHGTEGIDTYASAAFDKAEAGNKSKIEKIETKENINLKKPSKDSVEIKNVQKNTKERKGENSQEHALKIAEQIRQELIEHYSSKEYLDRLAVGYSGNEERAKEVQSERIKNLKTVEIDTSLSFAEFTDKMKSEKTNVDGIKNVFLAAEYDGKKVTVPYDLNEKMKEAKSLIGKLKTISGVKIDDQIKKILKDEFSMSLEGMLRHEITHAATGEYGEMSNNTIEILEKSYVPSGNGVDKYFKHPLELLERKKAMDREMEKLGIKKYGEEFIPEKHYQKVMDYYKKGLFSKDANEFILIIKKDPDVYKEIFNKIAENEQNGKDIIV